MSKKKVQPIATLNGMPIITPENRERLIQKHDTKLEPYGMRPMVVKIRGVYRQVFVD
jgi:hypothetical protein